MPNDSISVPIGCAFAAVDGKFFVPEWDRGSSRIGNTVHLCGFGAVESTSDLTCAQT